jgi:hypothetical protein
MLTNEGQRIRKSGESFGIPGRLTTRQRLTLEQLMSKDGDQRKESEKCGGGAQDGKVGPLSLRLHSQMSSDLVKGDFHLPPQNEPFQDGLVLSLLIGTQKRLGIEQSLRVSDEHPPDGDWWQSGVIPQVSLASSTVRVVPPYHATVTGCQTVPGSASRFAKVG